MTLDREIKRTVRAQAWAQVHLHQPWLEIRVKQDVEAKDFVAVLSMHLVLFHRLEHIMLTTGQSLDEHVKDT